MTHNQRTRSRSAFTMIELMVTVLVLSMLSAIAVHAYEPYKKYSHVRACHVNQKVILGAVQSYNIDKNTSRTDIPALIVEMVNENYLREIPVDPGQKVASAHAYEWLERGHGISCKWHGPLPD